MPEPTSSATDPAETLRAGNRVVTFGIIAIVVILLGAAVLLFLNLPDANAFNVRVERIFVQNGSLNTQGEVKLLEILAQSGTAFADVLSSYRRSEEHTSELQSPDQLVCRLLLETKKKNTQIRCSVTI